MRRAVSLLVLASLSASAQDALPSSPPLTPPPAPESIASEPVSLDPTVPVDTLSSLAAPARLDAYRADPDFQYDRPEAAGPSLWEQFWAWVYRTFVEPVFDNTTAEMWEWIAVIAGVLALAWVVTRLLRTEGGSPFARRDRALADVGPLLDVDDIEAVDLDALLADAVARGAYREAVRYRYLVLLQRAAEVGVVAWRRDKTNRDYLAEARASDAALARPFAQATRVFDYVWYGERPVDGARYAALAPTFERVEAALGTRPVTA